MGPIPPAFRSALARIRADRTRGAGELVRAAARALGRVPWSAQARSPEALDAAARAVARALLEAQPQMAPFYHLANAVMRAARSGDLRDRAERLRRVGPSFIEEADAYAEEAAARAAGLVPDGAVVLTYSRSGSVLAALRRAAAAGSRWTVRVSEARPQGEGRSVARAAARFRHRVEFFTDAGLFAAVDGATAVLLGADAVGTARFRNKVGTRALLCVAREAGVTAYLVADPLKLLPERFWVPEAPRPAREIWAVRRPGLEVRNLYFEDVPLRLLTGLILGAGLDEPRPPTDLGRWPLPEYFEPLEEIWTATTPGRGGREDRRGPRGAGTEGGRSRLRPPTP
jgi:translation initiation factor 2B subunit (eIF-2B alpha/beta/delta family)